MKKEEEEEEEEKKKSCRSCNFYLRTGRDEKKGKTQERMETGSRKRSSKCWE